MWKTKKDGQLCAFCGETRPALGWTSKGDKVRRRLRAVHGGLCWICGTAFTKDDPATIEHVIPRADGGTDHPDNLRLSHYSCNWKRGRDQDPHIDGRTGEPHAARREA